MQTFSTVSRLIFVGGIFVGLMPISVSEEKGMFEENPYHFSSVLKSLHTKLDPRRFSLTPEMGAAIGYILGANYGFFPNVEAITVVYDGTVLGKPRGSPKHLP